MKENERLRSLLEAFLDRDRQEQAKMLDEAADLEGILQLVASQRISNGLTGRAIAQANRIVGDTEDPRDLWKIEILKLVRSHTQLSAVMNSINVRIHKLIVSVSADSPPQWFLHLLKNQQLIPTDYFSLFRRKVEDLVAAFGQISFPPDGRLWDRPSGHT